MARKTVVSWCSSAAWSAGVFSSCEKEGISKTTMLERDVVRDRIFVGKSVDEENHCDREMMLPFFVVSWLVVFCLVILALLFSLMGPTGVLFAPAVSASAFSCRLEEESSPHLYSNCSSKNNTHPKSSDHDVKKARSYWNNELHQRKEYDPLLFIMTFRFMECRSPTGSPISYGSEKIVSGFTFFVL